MSKWVLIRGRYFNTDQIVTFTWDKQRLSLKMTLPDGNVVGFGDPDKLWYGILCRAVGVNGG